MQKNLQSFIKISGIVHIALGIAVIVWSVLAVLNILTGLWPVLELGDFFIPMDLGFTIIPEWWGMEQGGAVFIALHIIFPVVGHGLIIAGILYMRNLFKHLKNGESPFSKRVIRVVQVLMGLAFASLFHQFRLSQLLIVIALVLLYVIFEYGHALQNEADHTL